MSKNPSNLTALPAKQTADNGGQFAALLQPKHRAAFVATLPATVTSQTAVGTNVLGAVNSILGALVSAGIMKAS